MDEVTLGQVLLEEYKQLKDEQRARIRVRDFMPYALVIATGAVATPVITHGQTGLLLTLPLLGALMGWTFLVNDLMVSALGGYIRHQLAGRVGGLVGDVEVFGWETAHRVDPFRPLRKQFQLGMDLLAFGVIPLAAVVLWWVVAPLNLFLLAVSFLELGLLVVLIIQISVHDVGEIGTQRDVRHGCVLRAGSGVARFGGREWLK